MDVRRDGVHGRFTLRQLSRILSVSEQRLHRWALAGFIEPAEVVHRLAWFNFHEAAQAKRLCQLVDAGASVQDVQRGLRLVESWLGSPERLLARLSLLSGRRLIVRMADGQLAETTGQLRL